MQQYDFLLSEQVVTTSSVLKHSLHHWNRAQNRLDDAILKNILMYSLHDPYEHTIECMLFQGNDDARLAEYLYEADPQGMLALFVDFVNKQCFQVALMLTEKHPSARVDEHNTTKSFLFREALLGKQYAVAQTIIPPTRVSIRSLVDSAVRMDDYCYMARVEEYARFGAVKYQRADQSWVFNLEQIRAASAVHISILSDHKGIELYYALAHDLSDVIDLYVEMCGEEEIHGRILAHYGPEIPLHYVEEVLLSSPVDRAVFKKQVRQAVKDKNMAFLNLVKSCPPLFRD